MSQFFFVNQKTYSLTDVSQIINKQLSLAGS